MAKTRISSDCQFEGNLKAEDTVSIEGQVAAEVHSKGRVIVCRGGTLHGNVNASKLQVRGYLCGDIIVTDELEVEANGELDCHLKAPPRRLILSERAKISDPQDTP